ncbi:FAD-dependent oxidoreductase [Marinibaculum pumilum]|uniref:FAD-dependent oxidoreductase n=1 Tax=Marinibaculum pumilum TaxID=1766165 RepID=A0ABV7L0L7_9PROT
MKSHARAVVIGGGAVGLGTLYHLVQKGWRDVVLLERKELTSGSTWHAAGLLPLFNLSYSVGQIHKYSVALYTRLQEEQGLELGLRRVGNIRLAMTPDRMDEYRHYAGVAATIGVQVEFLTPDQVQEIWPLCSTDGLLGAIRHPQDGYVQPADLSQAFAALSRAGGAEIHRNTAVTAIAQLPGGAWRVTTDRGEIVAEHVVSCTGSFARRTAAMVGLDVPVQPVEHQFIVTEAHPEIQARRRAGLPEMGVLRESDGSWYMREEAGGLLLGPYETGAPCCYLDGPAGDVEYELFQEDLDRLAPHIESAIHRVPAFGELGVKRVYNGAIAYTPDGSPLIGPAPGLRNFWLNEGHSFGITAAGGAGWQLAEWIVEGEPGIDMLGVDPRRFGPYASGAWLREKNEEAYANVFTVHYPDEERPAARPLKTAPCHDRLQAMGAVFGQKYGWERANWFAPAGSAAEDHWSFRRSRWFDPVGAECRHVMDHVGLLDMTPFAKARLSGPGAEAFLDRLVANRLPRKAGRIALCHALAAGGGVHSEFTIQREAEDSFYLVSAAGYTRLDHDWLWRHLPDDGSVRFDDLTTAIGVLVVAGPKARTLLSRLTRADLSGAAFPWLSGQQIDIAGVPVKALRVNFVGELGWELHHPIEMQNRLFDGLVAAGADLALKPFGIRAMDSLRLEKSYRMVGAELSIEYAAWESGLDRFVHPDKGDFIGRDSLLAWRDRGFRNALVTLEVQAGNDADPLANAPVFANGEMAGRATSGGYGFRLERALALAMVDPALAAPGTGLELEILGRRHPAMVVADSPYDPENARLRA